MNKECRQSRNKEFCFEDIWGRGCWHTYTRYVIDFASPVCSMRLPVGFDWSSLEFIDLLLVMVLLANFCTLSRYNVGDVLFEMSVQYCQQYSNFGKEHIITPCACAQRGKVISSVVVVINTKFGRSRILGVFVSANCCW